MLEMLEICVDFKRFVCSALQLTSCFHIPLAEVDARPEIDACAAMIRRPSVGKR